MCKQVTLTCTQTDRETMGEKKRKRKKNIKDWTKGTETPKWTKNRDTITAFVRQVLGEWKELDSDKIVPHFKHKEKKKINLCEYDRVDERDVTATRQQEKRESFGRSSSTGQCADRQWEVELSQMLAARQNLLVRVSPTPLTPGKWKGERVRIPRKPEQEMIHSGKS